MSSSVAPPAFGDFTRLDDDNVKLVAYTIVSLRRDHEIIMPNGKDQVLVLDNITPDQFVAQLISDYVAREAWRPNAVGPGITDAEFDENRKYLRVYYVVSERWPKQPMRYEERQIEVLEEIRDLI